MLPDKDYLKTEEKDIVKLIVLGKDPYPTGPTKIPFMKKTWKEFSTNTAGCVVIESIMDKSLDEIKKEYGEPRFLFDYLKREGIYFLNASYKCVGQRGFQKDKDLELLKTAYEENKKILEKAKNIILCGNDASKAIQWVNHIFKKSIVNEALHPSYRGDKKNERFKTFWEKGALKTLFNLFQE